MAKTQPWDTKTSGEVSAPLAMSIPDFDPAKHRVHDDPREEALAGREREEWKPVSDLPEPEQQPGFAMRWVRVSNNNVSDMRNVAKRFGEGWEPVPAVAQPAMMKRIGKIGVNADGNIEIGGLMLCRIPEHIRDARNNYYSKTALTQVRAVDGAYMRDQDPRMPKIAPERSTTVTTGQR